MSYICNEKYVNMKLTFLLFDERIVDMVEENKCIFPEKLLNNVVDMGTFKLNQQRLDSIMNAYNTGLPPIKIKLAIDIYIVLNGRHRVCSVILNGGSSIPCIIVT